MMSIKTYIVSSLFHSMGNHNAMSAERETQVRVLATCIHMAQTTLDYEPKNHLGLSSTKASDVDDKTYYASRNEFMSFLRNFQDKH